MSRLKKLDWLLIVFFMAMIILFILEVRDIMRINSGIKDLSKDRVIYIESNAFDCARYSFNGDFFWRCGDELNISFVEKEFCKTSTATKMRRCEMKSERVVGKKYFDELNNIKNKIN